MTQKGITRLLKNKPRSHLRRKIILELQNAKMASNEQNYRFWVNSIKFHHFRVISAFLHFGGPDAQNTHNPCRLLVLFGPRNAKMQFYQNLLISSLFPKIPPKSAELLHFRKKSGISGNSTFLRFGGPDAQTDTQTEDRILRCSPPSRASGTKPVGGGTPPPLQWRIRSDIAHLWIDKWTMIG